jgi:type II secretory pathway pseudopilin PulG
MGSRSRERGYVLLTLMLFAALLVIAAAAAFPTIAFQIKRDRETELIHRGVQYRQAIRAFTKATGRFPVRVEELQSTDGRRFIRRLYKDPITGGDFRLLRLSDVGLAGPPSASTPTSKEGSDSSSGPVSANSSDSGGTPANQAAGTSDGTGARQNPSAQSSSSPGNDAQSVGVIIGVASKSKDRTIREFERKNHYKDWLFFYTPTHDRGVAFNGPTPLSLPSPRPANGATSASGQTQPQTPPSAIQTSN